MSGIGKERRNDALKELGSSSSEWESSTPEQRRKYMQGWTDMMVTIWREKIQMLDVIDTGALLRSVDGYSMSESSMETFTITHKFMEYGIFQELGTGNGYKHDNGGYLWFRDNLSYGNTTRKKKQKSGKITGDWHRVERIWFSKKYYASVMVMKEEMAQMYGQAFAGIISNAFNDLNRSLK